MFIYMFIHSHWNSETRPVFLKQFAPGMLASMRLRLQRWKMVGNDLQRPCRPYLSRRCGKSMTERWMYIIYPWCNEKTTPNSWFVWVKLDFYTCAWELRGRRLKKSAVKNSLSFLEQKPKDFLWSKAWWPFSQQKQLMPMGNCKQPVMKSHRMRSWKLIGCPSRDFQVATQNQKNTSLFEEPSVIKKIKKSRNWNIIKHFVFWKRDS